MPADASVLHAAEAYFRGEVAPRANEIDGDPQALEAALGGLRERELMALRRPERFGGPALGEPAFREFQEMAARASGCLAFLQTQHQSVVSMIAKGPNEELQCEVLPHAARERLIGTGFSQLRRGGPPLLRAEEADAGFTLDGHVPWVTGLGFFGEFLAGAVTGDGRQIFGIVPLGDVVATDGGEVRVSPPMRLAAMDAAQTVSAELRAWRLERRLVADVKPPGWIHTNDQINITLQGFFALGCAQAGLDVLAIAVERRGLSFVENARAALASELAEVRRAMIDSLSRSGEETTQEKLDVRAWAIDVMARCAHAAVTASSGAAASLSHPAQRVYREAMVFTVSAQTAPIMGATLARLVRR